MKRRDLSEASLERALADIKAAVDSQGKRIAIQPTHFSRFARVIEFPAGRPYFVAVSGGRAYRDRARVFATLDRVHAARPITMLIQGGARGADRLAREWADAREVNCLNIPAKWNAQPDNPHWRYRAGPVGNAEMSWWNPDLWLFFPGGNGTEDAFQQAKRRGIKRRRIR